MVIELQVAPGKQASIQIREGDSPSRLADNFGKTYNLNQKSRQGLE